MNERYQKMLQFLEKKLHEKGNVYVEVMKEGARIIKDLKENKRNPSTPTSKREKN